ncbi:YceH family protein [Desulfuromonas sp. TF]|uniref:YceH family protein n=1 Tax=Desulfuromonas sp. TF TaxID=1232410 RepID=UPI0003F6166E|nr:YceH family protein [Desulfuromonas sp. TF]
MEMTLNAIEVRVLGCLAEKEMTTPEYYPLSLNALTNACNQKTNREPVMSLDETDIVRALDRLRQLGLATQSAEGSRVPKYGHNLPGKFRLEPEELAVLTELLLRGAQTVGELRARADRMHPFADLAAVEEVLEELMGKEPPLAARLPRQPGRKEHRYTHLLTGEPEVEEAVSVATPEAATLRVRAENERIAALEEEMAALRVQFEDLKREMVAFKAQFE